MTIDPRLYEKYSGRSSDAYAKMGSALAGADAQRYTRLVAKDRSMGQKLLRGSIYAQFAKVVIALVFGGIILIALAF